jgi:hypothetical protein
LLMYGFRPETGGWTRPMPWRIALREWIITRAGRSCKTRAAKTMVRNSCDPSNFLAERWRRKASKRRQTIAPGVRPGCSGKWNERRRCGTKMRAGPSDLNPLSHSTPPSRAGLFSAGASRLAATSVGGESAFLRAKDLLLTEHRITRDLLGGPSIFP